MMTTELIEHGMPILDSRRTWLRRLPRRGEPMRVPTPIEGSSGLFVVDGTWGVIQPMTIAPGVRTVGELEVIEHIRAGKPLLDCRLSRYVEAGTIPGAVNIPHDQLVARIAELDQSEPTVVFCNGPQCTATGQAVNALLDAGWPAERLIYYRGGIRDWVTAGLPLADPASRGGSSRA
jgi:rhodanese-related sulfurtransferase